MANDKPILYGPDGRFVTYGASPKGRLGVVRLGRTLIGREFSNPNHAFRLARESDLPEFLARRIEVTVAKFQYALAQCFALGDTNPLLIVEGARLQHGQGHSSVRADGNRTLYSGTEAAHYGIGTITRQGDALSIHSAQRLLDRAAEQQVARREIAATHEASGRLIAFGMVQDASTYVAPAMINRVEGMLEAEKQRYLLGALWPFVPTDPARLLLVMNASATRVAELLMGQSAVLRPIEQRLTEIRHNPTARELWQDPGDPDSGNRIFGNRESEFLEATREQVGGSNSALQEKAEAIVRRIPERSEELLNLAIASQEEMA